MENLPRAVPLVVVFPLIGLIINLFAGKYLGEKASGWVGSLAAIGSFITSIVLAVYLVNSNFEAVIINPPLLDDWLRIDSIGLNIPWQMRVDTLSVTMMLVVTGVGSLIHIYATGYMHGDERFSRFFVYLNLFLAFMLILVTGNNFLMMFVGWEGVGLSSFLLIGFWFDKARGEGHKNSQAARKAFIANRVGDFGLLIALFLIFWTFGTLDYYKPGEIANVHLAEAGGHGEGEIVVAESGEEAAEDDHGEAETGPIFVNNDHLADDEIGVFGQAERLLQEDAEVEFGPISLNIDTVIVLITLFMLLGAAGKSAQIPLFVWLPDAMAGPTPVSALIHAATMVTAGVYLMTRSNVLFHEAELTSFVVAVIGAGTALMAGFIAMAQWDIKRVLAYSTISQLGFMVAAVGVGAYSAAMFHLVTHAFFKALLFLGSGSVIHGVEHGHHHAAEHDEDFDAQDMRNMGGLMNKMPLTYIGYLVGTLALAGIFPFAGFWSKDEILADSWLAGFERNNVEGFIVFGLLLAAAGFTAFYMWRQLEMVFHGKPRTSAAEHASESALSMTSVLMGLTFLSIFGGFLNTPDVLGLDRWFGLHRITTWLEASVVHAEASEFQILIALFALGLALFAIGAARSIYGDDKAVTEDGRDPLEVNINSGAIWQLAHARLYWDETYDSLLIRPFTRLGAFFADTLDWDFWHNYIHNTVLSGGFTTVGGLLSRPVDLGIIDGIVNGLGHVVGWGAERLRRVQTGYVRTYAISILLGVVLVIVVLLIPMIDI